MNRWKLTEDVKVEYRPIVEKFIDKLQSISSEEVESINEEVLVFDFSDTKLNPYTLCLLLEELGYIKYDQEDNGWELDFKIYLKKIGENYPSTCEKLCVYGCGMTFELMLSVSELI